MDTHPDDDTYIAPFGRYLGIDPAQGTCVVQTTATDTVDMPGTLAIPLDILSHAPTITQFRALVDVSGTGDDPDMLLAQVIPQMQQSGVCVIVHMSLDTALASLNAVRGYRVYPVDINHLGASDIRGADSPLGPLSRFRSAERSQLDLGIPMTELLFNPDRPRIGEALPPILKHTVSTYRLHPQWLARGFLHDLRELIATGSAFLGT